MRKSIGKVVFASVLMSCAAAGAFAQTAPTVELHGYMQNRLYANPDATARFVTQRVSLSALAKMQDKSAYVEVYFHPWVTDKVLGAQGSEITAEQSRTYIESAYVDLPFAEGKVRIGKGRALNFGMTPTYPNRKFTNYNILAETFTQDRIQGVQYAYTKEGFDVGASIYSDLRLGNRKIGDTPGLDGNRTVAHFAERDDAANISGRLGLGGKLGWSGPCAKIHFSAAVGGLIQEDANKVAVAYNGAGATTSDKDHIKYGVDAAYAKGTFVSSIEAYQGKFSFLTVGGYSLMVGYEPKDSRRVYLRYSALNNDQSPTADPLTWNTQQTMLGIVQPISKGIWAEFNYEKNTESGHSVDNDVMFVEFFTSF